MEQKILILGAHGMLGRALMDVFRLQYPTGWTIHELDITNQEDVIKKVINFCPSIIINAAAYTNVDKAEDEKVLAYKVNGYGSEYLSRASQKLNAILVYISTDYVFRGDRDIGYDERAKPDPINIYGQSKLYGEQKLHELCKRSYCVRTSWLFGPGGKNFIDLVLEKAKIQDALKVVDDQMGKPSYTFDIANAIKKILNDGMPYGIYHAVNETKEAGISRYEQAKTILKYAGLKNRVIPCSSAEYPVRAKRPRYSVLLNTKMPPLRNWEEALKEYLGI